MSTVQNRHSADVATSASATPHGHGQHPSTATPTSRYTFTPCRRMSELSLSEDSKDRPHRSRTSNTKYFAYELTGRSLQDRIAAVMEEDHTAQNHPNLSMVLDADKISIHNKRDMHESLYMSRASHISVNSEDESDEEDIGSSLSPGSWPETTSPQRIFNSETIFDDETDHAYQNDKYYDPTNLWLTQIYQDDDTDDLDDNLDAMQTCTFDTDQEDDENRPPRQWGRDLDTKTMKPTKRLRPRNRKPLEELSLKEAHDDVGDDEHRRKKALIADTTSTEPSTPPLRKRQFMRSLSPVRET